MADDVFKWGDTSFARPRPGAGRRNASADSPAHVPKPIDAYAGSVTPPISSSVGIGFSPLVQAATPLLVLIAQLRGMQASPDIRPLREQCLEHIKRFEDRAFTAGIVPRVLQLARYAICASLDEAVLSTMWGAQSTWIQNTLLMELHREAYGGENFFVMLERVSQEPGKYPELIELHYLCMALGFTGKYHGSERHLAQLRQIRTATFRHVREHRGAPYQELSVRWQGVADRRNPIVRYVPWWVVGAATLAVVAVTFTVLSARLRDHAAPVHAALAGLGEITSTRPSASPTLKQLLAPEANRRVLSIAEEGNQTTIIPEAANLFNSGSAEVNREYAGTLTRIAAALERVPGRVLVTGHTDDQPIRSGRYADNFELSRERAVSVARLLQRSLTDPGRVTWKGVGSSQPRVTPESTPESRARNRRVEIIHVP